MLPLRRPPFALLSRLTSPLQRLQYQCNAPLWSITRCRSSWPTVHPQKKRLKRIRKAIDAKNNPNSESLLSAAKDVPEPTKSQLYAFAVHASIPMVGFGIMDNAILLLAGEAIDVYLGVALGISTMCAAAIGNIFSDLCGVAFGAAVEDALIVWSKKIEEVTKGRVNLPKLPKLTHNQRKLRSVRWSGQMGMAAGLTIGCVIGMFPLLFFPDQDRSKEAESADGASSASKKLLNEQNKQLQKELTHWKENFRALEKEKNDALWDKGR